MELRPKNNNLAVWALFFGISRFLYKGNLWQFPLLENFRGDPKSHAATDKCPRDCSDEYTFQAGIVEDTETYVCTYFRDLQDPLFGAWALCRVELSALDFSCNLARIRLL